MIRGFYSAASSMTSQQTNLNTIANNIANASTTGFKPQDATFSSLMYQNLNGGAGAENVISNGNGVRIQSTGINFTQGDMSSTGRAMDVAIAGDGFFAVENGEDGSLTYTRDGNFKLSADESECFLVNSAGNFVLDGDGERIEIITDKGKTDGGKTSDEEKVGFDPTKIGVYSFQNNYGLELAGGNQFRATEASGEAEAVESPTIRTGYLEASAVQISREMVKMIEASKGFSFSSKVIQAADEMEKITNQLR